MCILDGNKYASRCREEGEQSWDILRDCMVLRNQRREPLLTSSAPANDYEAPQASDADAAAAGPPSFHERDCALLLHIGTPPVPLTR